METTIDNGGAKITNVSATDRVRVCDETGKQFYINSQDLANALMPLMSVASNQGKGLHRKITELTMTCNKNTWYRFFSVPSTALIDGFLRINKAWNSGYATSICVYVSGCNNVASSSLSLISGRNTHVSKCRLVFEDGKIYFDLLYTNSANNSISVYLDSLKDYYTLVGQEVVNSPSNVLECNLL